MPIKFLVLGGGRGFFEGVEVPIYFYGRGDFFPKWGRSNLVVSMGWPKIVLPGFWENFVEGSG